MRIRGRNLPNPILISDPSANSSTCQRLLVLPPKVKNTRGDNALIRKEEKRLHPNWDLPLLAPHGFGNSSAKSESQIISNQIQEWNKEAEENGGAEANIMINRFPTTSFSTEEKESKDTKKQKRSSAALMEGSRCSRINGRGWRCSQPTLVGYSLCEHHLGKGKQKGTGTGTVRGFQLGCTDQQRKNLKGIRGLTDREGLRKKKARSVSSLLDDNGDY